MIDLTYRVWRLLEDPLVPLEVIIKALMENFAEVFKAQHVTPNWNIFDLENIEERFKVTPSDTMIAMADTKIKKPMANCP